MKEPVILDNSENKFSWDNMPVGTLCLSPMAGVTDSAFRQICKKHGADVLFTEMASASMLLNVPVRSQKFLQFDPLEKPVVCQLMGGDPEIMAEAAKIVESLGFDGVDINMGCPEKKIVGNACGSSLLKDVETAAGIVEAVVKATALPVSVKMRSGFDDGNLVQPHFSQRMEAAGAKALAIHPRTKEQGYKGSADWNITRQIVESVKIPVGGSGDVTGHEAIARLMAETGVKFVWVARGAMGNPWIFEKYRVSPPTISEVIETALKHALLVQELKGSHGLIELRKHLTWYFSGFPGAVELREQVKTIFTMDDLLRLVEPYRGLTDLRHDHTRQFEAKKVAA